MKNIFTTGNLRKLPCLIFLLLVLAGVNGYAQAPVITAFSPIKGPVGTSVTITGSGFNATASNNIVFFGATRATVTAAGATSLTVTVPGGATYAAITALNTATGLAAYSPQFFLPTFTPNTGSIAVRDFAAKADFTVGDAPYSVVIGDIDGDGRPDLVVANRATNTLSVLRNTGSPASPAFAAKVDFATGALPLCVAIGDLDGDGKPDLVTANDVDKTLSVLRNTSNPGTISFAAKADFATASGTQFVAIGDLDGDGKPDLVAANTDGNTVSVFRNTGNPGNISFAAKVNFTTGSTPFGVAIGDIDGDGKADVAVANYGSNTISVLRNTGSPGTVSFAVKTDLATGIRPKSVAIGDIDGDGKPDLAAANYNNVSSFADGSISVLLNTGSPGGISFAGKVDIATGTAPYSVAIGDINGDGKPDLAIANIDNVSLSVLCNTGSPGNVAFATIVNVPTPSYCASIAIGDMDGDGKPDLVTTGESNNTVSVFRNSPASMPPPAITTFSPVSGTIGTSVTITGTGFNATTANNIVFFGATRAAVTAASITSLTVTVPGGATYGAITILNTGTALAAYSPKFFVPVFTPNTGSISFADFAPEADFATGTAPFSVAMSDIDGDGKPDIIIANTNSKTVSVLRNTCSSGSSSFAVKVDLQTGTSPFSVAVSDIDGDGKPDIVVTNNSSNTISVLRNTSSPGSISFAAKVDVTTGSSPWAIAIGDIDGDGRPDIIVSNEGEATLSVLRNTGGPGTVSFAAKVTLATGTYPRSVAIGDIDGDGRPDIAVTNESGAAASVLRNTSSTGVISFADKVDIKTGSSPRSLAIGDIDGDGKPDLVVANYGNTISVLRNNGTTGNISFAARVDLTAGSQPNNIAIGDIDGDGRPDLSVVISGSNTFCVLRNTSSPGNVSFEKRVNLTIRYAPAFVAIGDINGDGRPDLFTANTSGNNISVLQNFSAEPILSGLIIRNGVLSPAFDSFKTNYIVPVRDTTTFIRVIPTSAPGSTITVNGTAVISGTQSAAIPLAVGPNIIAINVTPADATTRTYTITVTRAPSPNYYLASLRVTPCSLSPVFDPFTNSYTASVGNGISAVSVRAVTGGVGASLTVNGLTVPSGTESGSIPLSFGTNTVAVVVTAQNGTTNTYTVTINRAAAALNSVYDAVSVSSPIDRPQLTGEEITVHQGVSPNGDGINDFLLIEGITNYPENALTIMNRAGQVIFEAKNYDNSTKVFDGRSTKTGAMQLPGTYFYSLDYSVKGFAKHKTGFIVLKY